MNRIGVFICNYNGKEWVMKCIDSLTRQTLQTFDIYVVDNASTDGTAECILDIYKNQVSVLRNSENLGGAGGFDRGLRTGLEKGYEYIVLLDNDIELDKKVIENMKEFLDAHGDVGIVGGKILIMDKPDTIQDFGNYLDFDTFKEVNGYSGKLDSADLPEVNECDYVPTCAVMIRAEVLKKSGTMPSDNFIYYDDIELSYKIGRQGYKAVALGNAKVWHKGGFRKANVSTFSGYYFLRNRLHFFAKYISEEDIGRFIQMELSEITSRLYGYYNKGMKELFQTTVYALDDFIHGVRGKAEDFKIMQIERNQTPFERIIADKKHICIIFTDNFSQKDPLDIYHIFLYIVTNIQNKSPQDKLWVSLKECGYSEPRFQELLKKVIQMDRPEFPMPEIIVKEDKEELFDLELKLCEHVRLVKETVLPQVYIDRYCNCITSEEDHEYIRSYSVNEKLFMEIYRPLLKYGIENIRKKEAKHEG